VRVPETSPVGVLNGDGRPSAKATSRAELGGSAASERRILADHCHESDGTLTPRSIAGTTLTVEEAAAQAALLIAQRAVIARDGTRIGIEFDTICIHADRTRSNAYAPSGLISHRSCITSSSSASWS
jgi:UPF0271 protein